MSSRYLYTDLIRKRYVYYCCIWSMQMNPGSNRYKEWLKELSGVEQPVNCTGTFSLKYSGAVHEQALLFQKGFDFLITRYQCIIMLSISDIHCNSCLPDLSIPVGDCDVCPSDLCFPDLRIHSDSADSMNKIQLTILSIWRKV